MPHILGNAGGLPPATHNETLLREAIDRLRQQVDECRTNFRRIDDLRMAEIKKLNAELHAARKLIERVERRDHATVATPVTCNCHGCISIRDGLAIYHRVIGDKVKGGK